MKNFWLLTLVGWGLLAGCSRAEVLEPLQETSTTNTSKAIFVIGLQFEDRNTPNDSIPAYLVKSEDLPATRLKADNRVKGDDNALYRPLYSIFDQKFFFARQEGKDSESYVIEKADRKLSSYQIYSIQQVPAGTFNLVKLEQTTFLMTDGIYGPNPLEPEKMTPQSFPLPALSWQLEAGKIYYLGDIKLSFITEESLFGLFTRRTVKNAVTLTNVSISDRFGQVKDYAQKTWPFFPADKMINLSQNARYVRQNLSWQEEKNLPAESNSPAPAVRKEASPKPSNGFW